MNHKWGLDGLSIKEDKICVCCEKVFILLHFFFFIFVVYDGVSCALLLLLRYGRINEKVYLAKVL